MVGLKDAEVKIGGDGSVTIAEADANEAAESGKEAAAAKAGEVEAVKESENFKDNAGITLDANGRAVNLGGNLGITKGSDGSQSIGGKSGINIAAPAAAKKPKEADGAGATAPAKGGADAAKGGNADAAEGRKADAANGGEAKGGADAAKGGADAAKGGKATGGADAANGGAADAAKGGKANATAGGKAQAENDSDDDDE